MVDMSTKRARASVRFTRVEAEMRADLAVHGVCLKTFETRGRWFVTEIGNPALWQLVDVAPFASDQQICETVLRAVEQLRPFIHRETSDV